MELQSSIRVHQASCGIDKILKIRIGNMSITRAPKDLVQRLSTRLDVSEVFLLEMWLKKNYMQELRSY